MYADYAKPYIDRLRQMNLRPSELGFADDSNESWAELALRFTISIAGVHTAIIGTTNPDNARANVAAAEKGEMHTGGPSREDQLREIAKAFAEPPHKASA